MPIRNPQSVVDRLRTFQRAVRDLIIQSRTRKGLYEVARDSAADTIYAIDAVVDPVLEAFCEEWGRETPLVLIAEGLENEHGEEGIAVFPKGAREEDAEIRVIVDPIDGTRGIMYDKRPAWALAGVAPNKGRTTRLRDIEIAVMTELPTSKMAYADVLWAIKGQGAHGVREDVSVSAAGLVPPPSTPLVLRPSPAATIAHGFAMVSNFFPGTKQLASSLMEHIVANVIGPADSSKALVFEDQYISTGGQFYELVVGHDRFNADLRPLFYRAQNKSEGLSVHPYDVASMLVAEEAGVILTDGLGNPLDGPLDHTTGLSWAGFANQSLHDRIQPLLKQFFHEWGVT